MAQGLFADLIKGRRDIEVGSAGIGAGAGQPPSPHAVDVMRELGIDIRHIRSKPLMAELVRKADFIFVMTYGHLDSMLPALPRRGGEDFPAARIRDRAAGDGARGVRSHRPEP